MVSFTVLAADFVVSNLVVRRLFLDRIGEIPKPDMCVTWIGTLE